MSTPTSIPVTILAGFLGAGKTTLLNHLLKGSHGVRIAVMVNDFGTINVDAGAITTVRGPVMELSNGCICCDMRGNLLTSVLTLLNLPRPPEHIMIEASGISDPVTVATTFRTPELKERTRLDGLITLVDAEHAQSPRLDAQLIHDQISIADIVVLNKIDLIGPERRVELAAWIRSIAPQARLFEAVEARVPVELLLGIQGDNPVYDALSAHHYHHHREEYGTWSYRSNRPSLLRETLAALKSLPAGVFRAKGTLWLADAPRLRFTVQVVGRRISTTINGPWDDLQPHTELVFIGTPGAVTSEELTRLLHACRDESGEAGSASGAGHRHSPA